MSAEHVWHNRRKTDRPLHEFISDTPAHSLLLIKNTHGDLVPYVKLYQDPYHVVILNQWTGARSQVSRMTHVRRYIP